MIGSIIGAAIGAAGSIFGGLQASKAMQSAKKDLERRKREEQNWFDRRYNENEVQRASSQFMLAKLNEDIKRRNKAAAGTMAVMGGSEEGLASTKAANADAAAEAAARIAASGDRRREVLEATHLKSQSEYDDRIANFEAQKANAIAKAVSGVGQAAGSLGTAIDSGIASRSATADDVPVEVPEEEPEEEPKDEDEYKEK